MTKQRRWQLKQIALGNCTQCGKKAETTLCAEHRLEAQARRRAAYVKKTIQTGCKICGCLLEGELSGKTEGYCYSCDPKAVVESYAYLERNYSTEYSAFGR